MTAKSVVHMSDDKKSKKYGENHHEKHQFG